MRTACLALLALTFGASAQTPLGTVTGLATDPSGSAISGATVTLTGQDTGVRRVVSTNSTGTYAFPDLQPGIYRLSAAAAGFRAIETRAFGVESYRTTRQDLAFELAGQSSDVLVTDAAPAMIQRESPG